MIIDNGLELNTRLSAVCQRLRARGHRITPQRLAVIEVVFASGEHPTAQQVYEELRGRFPTMSLTTVYKALRLLQELGEVTVVVAEPDRAHFDGADPRPHAHLICERCGAIADASEQRQPDWLRPAQERGWQIGRWRLELVGVCPACQKDGKE
ncbi:MAG: Fur family transcriptional regulator [Anaerolineae bacterium]